MPSEITMQGKLQVDDMLINVNSGNQRVDRTGDAFSAGAQDIPTTAAGTLVTVAAAVVTPGLCMFQNKDATNYIELGRQVGGTFYPLVKLLAGETHGPFRLAAASILYARANTATVALNHWIVEE